MSIKSKPKPFHRVTLTAQEERHLNRINLTDAKSARSIAFDTFVIQGCRFLKRAVIGLMLITKGPAYALGRWLILAIKKLVIFGFRQCRIKFNDWKK